MELGVECAIERINGGGDAVKPCPVSAWRGSAEGVFEDVQRLECDSAFRPDSRRDIDEAPAGAGRVGFGHGRPIRFAYLIRRLVGVGENRLPSLPAKIRRSSDLLRVGARRGHLRFRGSYPRGNRVALDIGVSSMKHVFTSCSCATGPAR